jgi:GABA(A) receptor-associated protein
MSSAKFQDEHDFEKRQSEASRIRSKYPNRIPVSACWQASAHLLTLIGHLWLSCLQF